MAGNLIHRLKWFFTAFTVVVVSCSAFSQTGHGARVQGLGGAFTAVADDPNALTHNPAGISLFDENAVVIHYTSMYHGFADYAIGSGAIGYIHHLPERLDFGVFGDMFHSKIYSHNHLGLNFARRFGDIAFGMRTNVVYTSFNPDNFVYGADDNPADPFFINNGYGNFVYRMDAGLLYTGYQDLSLGLYLRNLIALDNEFYMDDTDPLKARAGISYIWGALLLSLDIEADYEFINEELLNYAFGAEVLAYRSSDDANLFTLRSGINPDQFSAGFGYRNRNLANLSFDYAFIYPLSIVNDEVPGSHKFSLSMGFQQPKDTYPVEEISPEAPEVRTEAPETIGTEEVTIEPNELRISSVTKIYQAEPILPIVFFEPNSAVVDSRYDEMISAIGQRIAENPDVRLNLYGYYDPISDSDGGDDLAVRRAEAMRKRFVELSPESAVNIRAVRTGYLYDSPRKGIPEETDDPEQQFMINQENRRVELEVHIDEDRSFSIDGTNVRRMAELFKPHLARNPDIDLIIESRQNLPKAFELRREFAQHLDEELAKRVSVSIANDDRGTIQLDAQGILFRPLRNRTAITHSRIPDFARISLPTHKRVRQYQVSIVDTEGNTVKTIETGRDIAPIRLVWDWRDNDGRLVDVDSRYLVHFSGTDGDGNPFGLFSNDTISVTVTDRTVLEYEYLLAQFIYEDDGGNIVYPKDGLGYTVRKINEFADMRNKTITIAISGHTDILGNFRENRELSRERASAEYDKIRDYLMAQYGLSNETELNDWLDGHNTTIQWSGYGPGEPYTPIGDNGFYGNNSLPDGRTLNRRIEIKLRIEKTR